jgi:hypothetical protein
MAKTKKVFRKRFYIPIILVVVVIVVAVLEVTNTTHFFHKSPVVRAPSTPIAKLPVQKAANNGNKVSSSTPTLDKGTATDKKGQVPGGVPTDPSQWSISASGVITVKLPGSNSVIQPGATLTGSASIAQVQYRLTDDQVGVISEGPVSVVNGNFTASINFTTHSSGGRLDVFSTEPNGREINEVQIAVRF